MDRVSAARFSVACAAGIAACGLAMSTPVRAAAATPVAIVEDVAGAPVAGAAVMEYVAAGAVLHVAGTTTLTLGYLRSCAHEVISGGTVTVGADQSTVEHGRVTRTRVQCDGGRLNLTSAQAASGGVFTMRGGSISASPAPQVTLFGTSPLVKLAGGGSVRIERLDAAGAPLSFIVPAQTAFYDLAAHGQTLAAGGVYRARSPDGMLIFRIDEQAQASDVPLLGRLLPL